MLRCSARSLLSQTQTCATRSVFNKSGRVAQARRTISFMRSPTTATRTSTRAVAGTKPVVFTSQRTMTTVAKKNRPISPHITIYKFPLPAITSITTRITGVALTLGFAMAGSAALLNPAELVNFIEALKVEVPAAMPFIKGTVAFPFIYHYLSGLRHLFWDETARGLELKEVYASSWLLVGATAILTAAAAVITI